MDIILLWKMGRYVTKNTRFAGKCPKLKSHSILKRLYLQCKLVPHQLGRSYFFVWKVYA